ncbi:MAG: coniferyl aldehyde dehydrogenase [Caulobacterales bacterium]|nr:coniferyl aldehyde dehydrogenase [Caulobacterales bacterium]MCA0372968.1 coniferyl aldehyde dehydrogenase [Pseudomonadota bacterium]
MQKSEFTTKGNLSVVRRKEILRTLVELLVDNSSAICDALNDDFSNRAPQVSLLTDIGAAVSTLKHALSNIDKWVKPENHFTSPAILGLFGARAQIQFQAKGVVGIIVPWNFPINLSFGPLASAIAAGNRAMVKLSEFTPQTSKLIEELIGEKIDKSEIAIINGGIDVAQEFSALPFDHLLFTGATEVGKIIMGQAAKNLVPVTLELGGKSPVIVTRNFDKSLAAARIMGGKLMNAGQVCLAPDYLLVEENYLDEFVDELMKQVKIQYPKIYSNPEYTAIINDRHYGRLMSYIDEAKASGVKVIKIDGDETPINSRKIAPYLVINPDDNLKIMQDEIFGPLLPIKTYKNIDEAIAYVNSRPRPLALYYFDNDKNAQDRILNQTISGGVTINDVILHIAMEELPFGGVGASGIGAYHGKRGFLEFSHQKAIFKQSPFDNFLLKATRAPYGKVLEKYLEFTIRK